MEEDSEEEAKETEEEKEKIRDIKLGEIETERRSCSCHKED